MFHLFLLASLAFSVTAVVERHSEMRRISLNSRGDVSLDVHDDVAPWELRKSFADPPVPQMPVEDLTQETDENSATVGEFIQPVNGSTPTGLIKIGTPGKELLAIFDTGSDKLVAKTWETLQNEMAQLDPSSEHMATPQHWVYDHNSSKTYKHEFVWKNDTKEWVPKRSIIAYGSGEAETIVGDDTIEVGRVKLDNFSLSEITADSLQLLHTKKGISAVFGLQHMKNGSLGSSFFSVARSKNLLTSFGYVRGTGDNGTFIWGDQSSEGHPIPVVGDMHWAIKLGNIQVMGGKHASKGNSTNVTKPITVISDSDPGVTNDHDGAPKFKFATRKHVDPANFPGGRHETLPAPMDENLQDGPPVQEFSTAAAICANNSCCGILDTGSNIIAGPRDLMKGLNDQLGVQPSCANYDSLPDIQINIGGLNLNISKEGYVMKVPLPRWADTASTDRHEDFDDSDGTDRDDDSDDEDGDKSGHETRWGQDDAGSLNQRFRRRQRSKTGWEAVFEHLHKNRGIDLKSILRQIRKIQNATGDKTQPPFMCMPALVPLDKHTKYGPLFVVGTPLLQTHYARWSFPKNAASPTIFIEKLHDCKRCKGLTKPTKGKFLEELSEEGKASLVRSERPALSESTPGSRGPFIREVDDIFLPHWAMHLTDV